MMRIQITYITKEDFFDAFVKAFHASITANNIQAGFKVAGLVPFDPESVISRLDPKPITPSPLNLRPRTASSWVPKTLSNAYDATQSSSTLKRKIENHQGSSLTFSTLSTYRRRAFRNWRIRWYCSGLRPRSFVQQMSG
jgi:hypothetical protein